MTLLSRNTPLLDFYSVSYMWYTPIAVGSVLIVGLIVSYLTHPLKPGDVDPKLIIRVQDICCCCLPKQVRAWFGCDAEEEQQSKNEVRKNEFSSIVFIMFSSIISVRQWNL